ncbi:hypothetical protein [Allomesorhizobium alhagi]|uniref:Uncharacterized protein n=1 Tax=Mesorhizobium alhagi CCNWXJ12-2 TaxID=1107882 RepID=H0HR58_9HYPH|nr:hypothetical protein [Mesorhizobium alhagi]EHK56792.1 hypothetical protein MAXJ12_13206 [Mesorhizobium alhagi CCNWXJ12-2]
MKAPYDYSHIRQKDGESLAEYFTRVVADWAVAESKGRVARVRHALHHMQGLAEEAGLAIARRESGERLLKETAALKGRIADLEAMLRGSVSKIEAEEERRKAAVGMRTRASLLAEGPDGEPNGLSEAIYALPLPSNRWVPGILS